MTDNDDSCINGFLSHPTTIYTEIMAWKPSNTHNLGPNREEGMKGIENYRVFVAKAIQVHKKREVYGDHGERPGRNPDHPQQLLTTTQLLDPEEGEMGASIKGQESSLSSSRIVAKIASKCIATNP